MFVGDFDFAILFAILRDKNNDAVIRHYRFERAEVEEDIRWVVGKEEAFYKHIENGTMPPQILTL